MLNPNHDVDDRAPVWESFQWIYQDTDPVIYYEEIVKTCAASKYSISELEEILFNEVLPALRFNLLDIAGDWQGYATEWLTTRVLEKHRFGKRRPLLHRKYTKSHWKRLKKLIESERAGAIKNAI